MEQHKNLLISQPIYTCAKELFGFELFFPDNSGLSTVEIGGDSESTSEFLLNLATGITEQAEIYSRPMFLHLPDSFLNSDQFLGSLSRQIVIEVSAEIQKHDLSVKSIEKWRGYGFQFVLDDFDFSRRHKELLPLFDYIKIDARRHSPQLLAEKQSAFSEDTPARIVKHIETEAQFLAYVDLGATLFQGYFLARPVVVRGVSLRNKINRSISLSHTINHPDVEIDQLVEAVSSDPSLATQILKIINSPLCGLNRPVESIRDAIVYLGLGQVRKWIMIMSMVSARAVAKGTIRLVLTRAKTCERLAEANSSTKPDQAFLAGLVSGVDLLFGIEPQEFLEQVMLDQDIEKAILEHQGDIGQILIDSLAMERRAMQAEVATPEPCADNILSAYMDASTWAEKVLKLLP